MNMRGDNVATTVLALFLIACGGERPDPGVSVCGRFNAQPEPWTYEPRIHVPGLHASEFESAMNHTRAIGERNALLDMLPNERLRIPVSFLSTSAGTYPDTGEMDSIVTTANEWGNAGNIEFYRASKGVVRIRLTGSSVSSSVIGKHARSISRLSPTMELGLLRPIGAPEHRWVVLHEFGHALGLVHEHQNSTVGRPEICWDEQAVRAALRSVDAQSAIFAEFKGPAYTARAYDSASVMVYHAPPAWTCDKKGLPLNDHLSAIDEQTIAELYPRRGPRRDQVRRAR